ncbi:hypothetical protein WA026_013114 [Henosepilachna vigintioctopunctata]|uniref:Uncharacterized protein n=1 Tax=Henosepilachna vigintioctopunctata TaxID=420089 RepID=A0AAW1ULY1_9CUCU
MLTPFQLAHMMRPSWKWGRFFPPTGEASASTEVPCSPRPTVLLQRYLAQLALATTGFHRFLARFSGRRRWRSSFQHKSPPPWINFLVLVLASSLFNIVVYNINVFKYEDPNITYGGGQSDCSRFCLWVELLSPYLLQILPNILTINALRVTDL